MVHRIDKDTSGLLVIAKTEEAMAHLSNQFAEKTSEREYVALVWGNVEEDEGTIEAILGDIPRTDCKILCSWMMTKIKGSQP